MHIAVHKISRASPRRSSIGSWIHIIAKVLSLSFGHNPMEKETLLSSYEASSNSQRRTSVCSNESLEAGLGPNNLKPKKNWVSLAVYFFICSSSLLIGFLGGTAFERPQQVIPGGRDGSVCESPPVRREWRSLSTQEKDDYIDSVLCLSTKPSRMGMNQSLYDDFSWTHYQFNEESKID
jgi:hypothetical protein